MSDEARTGEVTRLLDDLRQGQEDALPVLLDAVHAELRQVASRHLARERADHTLQPTALVNEAYLKLVDQRSQSWESREHFLSIASTAMRRILLQHARARLADKRGAGAGSVTLFDAETPFDERPEELVALDGALERLAEVDPDSARLVELRFFGGLSVEETARVTGTPQRTVERTWRSTRAWLKDAVSKELAAG